MAVIKGKSQLLAKYGNRLAQAVQQHADAPPEAGRVDLPPGIRNGVARLTDCYFGQVQPGKQNAGEYFFRAVGVVVEPKSVVFNGQDIGVEGLQTSIMEMVCDTKKQDGTVVSLNDHVKNVMNHLKLLGAGPEAFAGGDLEAVAAALKQAGPYFRFSTSPRKDMKTGEVTGAWENWHGGQGLEDYQPPAERDVEDSSADRNGYGPADDVPDAAPAVLAHNAAAAATPQAKAAPTAEPDTLSSAADNNLDELAEAADGGDDDAQQRLGDLAAEEGVPEDQVTGAASWAAVAELIRAARGEGAQSPAVGTCWKYAPVNARTKKAGEPVPCEVVAVADGHVTLKNLANPKMIYKNVPVAQLLPAD